MKTLKILPLLLLLITFSCASVQVNSDYDKSVDFSKYKTFAYYKTGIDKVEISDLDKKRILRSIDAALLAKGFTKSDHPDLLINLNAKAEKNVNVNQFYSAWGYGWGPGWGWGWSPFWGGYSSVNNSTDGILTIDLIDAEKKELIWQGTGVGYLTKNVDRKDEVINNFVTQILAQYPPAKK